MFLRREPWPVRRLVLEGLLYTEHRPAWRISRTGGASQAPTPRRGERRSQELLRRTHQGQREQQQPAGRKKKSGSGGSAGQKWCTVHKTTTHNDAECYSQGAPRSETCSTYTAAVVGALTRTDTDDKPVINFDDFNQGFAFELEKYNRDRQLGVALLTGTAN